MNLYGEENESFAQVVKERNSHVGTIGEKGTPTARSKADELADGGEPLIGCDREPRPIVLDRPSCSIKWHPDLSPVKQRSTGLGVCTDRAFKLFCLGMM